MVEWRWRHAMMFELHERCASLEPATIDWYNHDESMTECSYLAQPAFQLARVRSASFPATTTSLLHIHMSFDPPGILITRQLRRMLRSYRKPMLWLHAFNYYTTSRAASWNLIFSEVTHPDFDLAQLTVRRSTDVIDVVEESRMGDRMAVVQYSAGRLPPICSGRGSGHQSFSAYG